MLRFLADEDFNGAIVRQLLRRVRTLDLVRIQDIDRSGEADQDNLEYAAQSDRILLTHDKRLIAYVVERLDAGQEMPGVFVIHQTADMGLIITDLVDLTLYSLDHEWQNQVLFVPLAD